MDIAHINGTRVQTTQEHCRETAIAAGEIAAAIGAENIGYLSGLLHDIGKLCTDFNLYITKQAAFSRGEIDHSYAGAKYIAELAERENICYDSSRLIGRAIAAHHGLQDNYDENGTDRFKLRISKNERYDEIKAHISSIANEDEIKRLLLAADEEYVKIRKRLYDLCRRINDKKKSKIAYAFYLGLFERLIESVLIDADRTNTADFMSDAETSAEYDTERLWREMDKKINIMLNGFSEKKDKISMRRMSISDRFCKFASDTVHICRLVVPTGGGKTLSSLRFAIEYCRSHDMKRIFYVAPFMSILEQNSDVIRAITGSENFLEHHSDFLSEIDDENELSEYELHTEKWDMPVIATTMVQFLNALFSGRSSDVRRMHRFDKSVIIIDEVQSIPLKCINLFDLAMNFLSELCGCAIVLCSATQPVFDRIEYPIIIDERESMTGDYSEDFEVFKRTEIVNCVEAYGYTYDRAAEFCYERLCASGNILVVVNTKAAALRLAELIKNMLPSDDTALIHLSTNMCPEHRRKKIAEMKIGLSENKPIICITTQLIEAGVDISFRCVVRSLAGLDNIAQAAGRCNRNGEEDGICPVYVINLKDENLTGLSEIRETQRITRKITEDEKYSDCLSAKALLEYYDLLFKDMENDMSYKLKHPDTTLLDLLSLNSKWHNSALSSDYSNKNIFSAQAFKTAGRLFEVIGSDTISVVVPYDKNAADIIEQLEKIGSGTLPDKASALLRKAQKYTVNVYRGTFLKLSDENAVYRLECGVFVLNTGYYSDEFGINIGNSELSALII